MTPCTRKTWLGRPACRFEARYEWLPEQVVPVEGYPEMVQLLAERQVYVRDICRSCGKTIEREKQA